MSAARRTHYEILGITRNAKSHEVKRAYDRIRAELRAEAAAPDPRRMVQLQTAYEVLSDDARRAAYDEELARGPVRPGTSRIRVVAVASAIAIVAALAWLATRPARPKPRSPTEILSMLTPAVGRVHAVDMSGGSTVLGLAFAIDRGRLAMRCAGLAPNTQLVVRIGTRDVPARVADAASKHGDCLLAAPEAGSWPLALAGSVAQAGDRLYAAQVGPTGDVSLLEGRVQRIERGARGAVLEVSGPAARAESGAPLVDAWGRVLAIADGLGRGVPIGEGATAPE